MRMRSVLAIALVLVFQGVRMAPAQATTALDRRASLRLGANLIDQETKDFLRGFKSDPRSVIDAKKNKFNVDGTMIVVDPKSFLLRDGTKPQGVKTTDAFTEDKEWFVSDKICQGEVGQGECLSTQPGRRGIGANDRAERLVDNGRETTFNSNLFKMAEQNLTRGRVAEQPWSSDYWALASGTTAKRYLDDNWPNLDWHEVQRYYAAWFTAHGANAAAYIDQLSPAEKYDMLVGDANWTLTKAQLDEARPYAFNQDGSERDVERWMGICHGWAAAAYVDKRPRKTVVAYSPTGVPVTFYPDDIKALSVLKWANGRAVRYNAQGQLEYSSRFIGGRCNLRDESIERDPATGAVTNDNCFDSNPGAWHKSVVNQVGINKRSFVMDVTFDYEVWNQPVYSYSYTYFNPATLQPAATIRAAMQPIGSFNDRLAHLRARNYPAGSARPSHIVGVIMEVQYMVETMPQGSPTNDESRDAIRTVRYVYDLEITEAGEILGGEWYENSHPDFLWTPAPGSFAWNDIDQYITSWSVADSPANLTEVARRASASSIPLKAVVDGLIDAAQ